MEIKAQLNNLRIAPRKVRLVSRYIKGLDAMVAKSKLNYLAKRSGRPISKLIDSAMANAQNNFGLVKENLFIKEIIVNEGRKLKRFRPKGFGTTSPIEKKTSHIRIVLDERTPGLKANIKKKEERVMSEESSREATDEKAKIVTQERKPTFAKEGKVKPKEVFGGIKGLGRRFFRRKAI